MPGAPRCLRGVEQRLAAQKKRMRDKLSAKRATQAAENAENAETAENAENGGTSSADEEHEREDDQARARVHDDYKSRKKVAPKSGSKEFDAVVDENNNKNIKIKLPPLKSKRWSSFMAFEEEFFAYLFKYRAVLRIRSSESILKANLKLAAAYENRRASAEERGEVFEEVLVQYPPDLKYTVCRYICTHGGKQASRGKGKRPQTKTKFKGCPARVQLQLDKDKDGFFLVARNETTTHNHPLDDDLYEALITSSELTEPSVLENAIMMRAADGKTRKILDLLNRISSRKLTARMLYNFWTFRMGGATAREGFEYLVDKFSSFDGADCMLFDDQDNVTHAAVFQTAAQLELFNIYGDTVVFDWTHNTNNMGFYVGAFLVTTATGHGVSVADFMSTNQTKDTMRAMFRHFLSRNPSASDKIISFVIDKDYREWATLKEVFPKATVLLCQFHVIKWFKQVVREPKYNIGVGLQDEVVAIIKSMVYAPTKRDFDHECGVLRDLLSRDDHEVFHKYTRDRWFNCVQMWADCERKKVFDGTNGTSNRLESFWFHYKDDLGDKKRIDSCLEAIFLYATSVLQREKAIIIDHKKSTRLHTNCHDFIRSVLADLSDYTAALVRQEWEEFFVSPVSSYSASSIGGSLYVVQVQNAREFENQVDASAWACSCNFYSSAGLPCRHLFYVASIVEKMLVYPAGTISERWSMSAYERLLPQLSQGIDELATLRLVDPVADGVDDVISLNELDRSMRTPADQAQVDKSDDAPRTVAVARASVAHFRVPRMQVSDCVVLDDLEKRRIVLSLLDPLISYLMGQSSLRFSAFSMELAVNIDDWIKKWKQCELPEIPKVAGSKGKSSNARGNTSLNIATAAGDDRNGKQGVENMLEEVGDEFDFSEATKQHGEEMKQNDEEMKTDGEPSFMEDHAGFSPIPFSPHVLDPAATFEELVSPGSRGFDASGFAAAVSDPNYWRAPPVFHPMSMNAMLCSAAQEDQTTRASSNHDLSQGVMKATAVPSPTKLGEGSQRGVLARQKLVRRKSKVKITLPDVIRRGRLNSSKQLTVRRPRTAYLPQRVKCPVFLDEFVVILKFLPLSTCLLLLAVFPMCFGDPALFKKRAVVRHQIVTSNERINFTVHYNVLTILRGALTLELKERQKVIQDLTQSSHRSQPVVYLMGTGKSRGFSAESIQNLIEYKHLSSALRKWKRDVDWLSSTQWWEAPDGTAPIPFLLDQAEHVEGEYNTLCSRNMRAQIKDTFEGLSLGTIFTANCTRESDHQVVKVASIKLENVVGALARAEWLNDAVVNFALNALSGQSADVVVIDSLNKGRTVLPSSSLRGVRLLAFPINFHNSHWCVINVLFDWELRTHYVRLYDPSTTGRWRPDLEKTWKKWCLPLIEQWFVRDFGYYERFGSLVVELDSKPVQNADDGYNCGVLVIAHTLGYIMRDMWLHYRDQLSDYELRILRLRILWLIVCQTHRTTDPKQQSEAWSHGQRLEEFYREDKADEEDP